jgi:hypothetical protein
MALVREQAPGLVRLEGRVRRTRTRWVSVAHVATLSAAVPDEDRAVDAERVLPRTGSTTRVLAGGSAVTRVGCRTRYHPVLERWRDRVPAGRHLADRAVVRRDRATTVALLSADRGSQQGSPVVDVLDGLAGDNFRLIREVFVPRHVALSRSHERTDQEGLRSLLVLGVRRGRVTSSPLAGGLAQRQELSQRERAHAISASLEARATKHILSKDARSRDASLEEEVDWTHPGSDASLGEELTSFSSRGGRAPPFFRGRGFNWTRKVA